MLTTKTAHIYTCDRCFLTTAALAVPTVPRSWTAVIWESGTTRHLCPACSRTHSRFFANKTTLPSANNSD